MKRGYDQPRERSRNRDGPPSSRPPDIPQSKYSRRDRIPSDSDRRYDDRSSSRDRYERPRDYRDDAHRSYRDGRDYRKDRQREDHRQRQDRSRDNDGYRRYPNRPVSYDPYSFNGEQILPPPPPPPMLSLLMSPKPPPPKLLSPSALPKNLPHPYARPVPIEKVLLSSPPMKERVSHSKTRYPNVQGVRYDILSPPPRQPSSIEETPGFRGLSEALRNVVVQGKPTDPRRRRDPNEKMVVDLKPVKFKMSPVRQSLQIKTDHSIQFKVDPSLERKPEMKCSTTYEDMQLATPSPEPIDQEAQPTSPNESVNQNWFPREQYDQCSVAVKLAEKLTNEEQAARFKEDRDADDAAFERVQAEKKRRDEHRKEMERLAAERTRRKIQEGLAKMYPHKSSYRHKRPVPETVKQHPRLEAVKQEPKKEVPKKNPIIHDKPNYMPIRLTSWGSIYDSERVRDMHIPEPAGPPPETFANQPEERDFRIRKISEGYAGTPFDYDDLENMFTISEHRDAIIDRCYDKLKECGWSRRMKLAAWNAILHGKDGDKLSLTGLMHKFGKVAAVEVPGSIRKMMREEIVDWVETLNDSEKREAYEQRHQVHMANKAKLLEPTPVENIVSSTTSPQTTESPLSRPPIKIKISFTSPTNSDEKPAVSVSYNSVLCDDYQQIPHSSTDEPRIPPLRLKLPPGTNLTNTSLNPVTKDSSSVLNNWNPTRRAMDLIDLFW